jgi:hypothetical protein
VLGFNSFVKKLSEPDKAMTLSILSIDMTSQQAKSDNSVSSQRRNDEEVSKFVCRFGAGRYGFSCLPLLRPLRPLSNNCPLKLPRRGRLPGGTNRCSTAAAGAPDVCATDDSAVRPSRPAARLKTAWGPDDR